jgi:hypothetical protein
VTTEKIRKQARKLGAAVRGLAGILSTLEGEHAEVDSLMDKILEADDADRREELYRVLRVRVLAHAKAEASEFYPVCSEYPETRSLVPDALREHEEIERMIARLDVLAIRSPIWVDAFAELRHSIMQHVREEEEVLLERCKTVISRERLRALDRNYRARRELLEQDLENQARPPVHPEPFPPGL